MMKSKMRVAGIAAGLLLCAGAARAQQPAHALDRGSMQLSGAASFTSQADENDDERTTVISLNPRARWFLAPGLAVGADVLLGRQSRGEASSTTYGIGPAVTYYFGAGSGRASMHPYITGSVDWSRIRFESGPGESEATSTSFSGGAGLIFFVSDAVGITSELFYRKLSVDNGTSERTGDTYGLQLGVAAFIF